MKRRTAAIAGALVMALTVVTGSGAFTAITAERPATVEVVGDADQLLRMSPSEGPNGEYAQFGGDGLLEIDVSNGEFDAGGVGGEAVTLADDVFTVRNQGTQPVSVWIEDQETREGDRVLFYHGSSGIVNGIYDEADPGTVGFPSGTFADSRMTSPENAVLLAPGESISVGIAVDTQGLDPGTELLESIRVHANAAGAQPPSEGPQQVTIEQLNRNPDRYIGETVRVQGTLHNNVIRQGVTELRIVDNSVFVSDYRRVAQDRTLSPDGTLPFTLGEVPLEQRSEWSEGNRFELVGTVQPGDLENEETAQVSLNISDVEPLGASQYRNFVQENVLLDPSLTLPTTFDRSECRFAVIASGGVDAANNNQRYWNDITYTYKAMNDSFGLPDDQIYVHYFRGAGTGHATPVDGRSIVDANASERAINSTFDDLTRRITNCGVETELMVFTYNHGTNTDPEGKSLLGYRGDGSSLTPVELRTLFEQVNGAGLDEGYVMMKQCYSGQFLNARSDQPNVDLIQERGTQDPVVTAIGTAGQNDELTYSTTGQNGVGIYGYHFVAALAGTYPNGTAVSPSAVDLNGDGDTSWYEAHEYAEANDQFAQRGLEDPQFTNSTSGEVPGA